MIDRRVVFVLLIAVAWLLCWSRAATAVEPICPGGSSPRADIVWCADFENQAGCVTGTEDQCWTNDGYQQSPNPNNLLGELKKVTTAGTGERAAVGNGWARAIPLSGSVGFHSPNRETIQQNPNTKMLGIRYRFYVRYKGGYVGMPSGHGFQAQGYSDDFLCGNAVKWQTSSWSNLMHVDGEEGSGCSNGTVPNQLKGPNVHSIIPLLNNRWNMIEVAAQFDTACTNTSVTPFTGCNGFFRAWVNGVQTHDYSGQNLARLQAASLGHVGLGFYQLFVPLSYFHYGYPPWPTIMDVDNLVVSNNPALTIGAAPNDCVALGTCGTGDPSSPYLAMGPYWAFLGRHAGGDYTPQGFLGEYNGGQYRGSQPTLDSTRFHGTYVNQDPGHRVTQSYITSLPGPFVGTLFTIYDGTNGAVGTPCTGGGTTQRNCQWNGSQYVFTNNTDNSMKVHLTSSGTGNGLVHQRQDVDVAFPSYSNYGWIYLPSSNTYAGANVVYSGFVDHELTPTNWIGLTTTGAACPLTLGVRQLTSGSSGNTMSTATISCDAWHEYQIQIFNDGTVSLMLDHSLVLNRQPLALSSAWAFVTGGARIMPYPVVGVIDFVGTPTFDAWFDDATIVSPSAWNCDGWGAASCPFGHSYTTGFDVGGAAGENPICENQGSGCIWQNGGLDDGGTWQNVRTTNSVATWTNVQGTNNDCTAIINPARIPFGPDQDVQVVIHRVSSGFQQEAEIRLRATMTPGSLTCPGHTGVATNCLTGYEILADGNGIGHIVRWNGALGDFTDFGGGDGVSYGEGDVMRATISGASPATIKVYRCPSGTSGVCTTLIRTFTDATPLTTGNPGIGFAVTGGTPGDVGFSSFTATDAPSAPLASVPSAPTNLHFLP